MTFDEATLYIYKICVSWARSCRRRFEVDELFNEVWIGFGGDVNRFGEDYALMGLVASRHIIRYVKERDGHPGSNRYVGIRKTERLGGRFDLSVKTDEFTKSDNRDECEHLMLCLSTRQKFIVKQYFAGRTMAGIGQQLGLKRTAVQYHQSRALHKIRYENQIA